MITWVICMAWVSGVGGLWADAGPDHASDESLQGLLERAQSARTGDPSGANDLAQEGLRWARELGNQEQQSEFLLILAWTSQVLGEYEEGIRFAKEGLRLGNTPGNPLRMAEFHLALSLNLLFSGNQGDARKEVDRALTLLENAPASTRLRALNVLAVVEHVAGNLEKAMEAGLKALRELEDSGDSSKAYTIQSTLATLSENMGEPEKAQEYLLQALEGSREAGDDVATARILNNLGSVYGTLGQWDLEQEYLEQSLEIKRALGDQKGLISTYANMAQSLRGRDPESAMVRFRQALSIARETADLDAQTRILQSMAGTLLEMNQPAQALDHAQQSLQLAQGLDSLLRTASSYSLVASAYEALGQHGPALDAYKRYKKSSDQWKAANDNKRIKTLKGKFDLESKEKEIRLLHADREAQTAILAREALQIRALLGALLALLLTIGLLLRLMQVKHRSEAAIRQKNSELESALAEIKTLSGLLPICCHCKRVRDDQGYWHQVEQFVSDRSSAEFSHGLCPECARDNYGVELSDAT